MKWLLGEWVFGMLARWVEQLTGIGAERLDKILGTLLVVGLAWFCLRLAKHSVIKRVADTNRRYLISKTLNYLVGIVSSLIVMKIWVQADVELVTYLGILSAGLAIVLQDPIANLAGWAFLVVRQPFRVGDRIQLVPVHPTQADRVGGRDRLRGGFDHSLPVPSETAAHHPGRDLEADPQGLRQGAPDRSGLSDPALLRQYQGGEARLSSPGGPYRSPGSPGPVSPGPWLAPGLGPLTFVRTFPAGAVTKGVIS